MELVLLSVSGNTDVLSHIEHGDGKDDCLDVGSRVYARVQNSANPEIYLTIRTYHTGEESCYIDIGSEFARYDIFWTLLIQKHIHN